MAMTRDQIKEVNRNKSVDIYPETLHVGGIYRADDKFSRVGSDPFVLVESNFEAREYMLVSLRDGMPAFAVNHVADEDLPAELGFGTEARAVEYVGAEGDFIGRDRDFPTAEAMVEEQGMGFKKRERNGQYVSDYELRRFLAENGMEKVADSAESYFSSDN